MLLSVFLPFFNFLCIACFGRFIGKVGTIYITTYSLLILIVLNIKLLLDLITFDSVYYVLLGSWMRVGELEVDWEFYLDPLAVSMLMMVSIISTVVHCYSFSYMKADPHFIRFISYLSLFTFFMFILVTAGNFVQLFLGWEGVGLCSYLLINFWFTRIQANKAAIKAMLMNRVGDIGFLIGTSLTFAVFKTLDFETLHGGIAALEGITPSFTSLIGTVDALEIICFFLFIGVAGKSAQIGLHTWLPAAMEGPTPVSALIHAATMVTAGIFLLIRCSFLFNSSPRVQILIVILGACTAFISALTAMFLYDIKKIIAYSTCSQLGYMAVACGLSNYTVGLFHLVNHAFFKALLFLTAGAIIHSFNNEQDIRKLTGLATRMPFIHSAVLIGNIAIMGLPFLSGFYSKDIIIELTYVKGADSFNVAGWNLLFFLLVLATFCTGVYSVRMYYYLFLRQGVLHSTGVRAASLEQPMFIKIALMTLMVGSLFSGYTLSEWFALTTNVLFVDYLSWDSAEVHDSFVLNSRLLEGTDVFANGDLLAACQGVGIENELLPWYIKIAPLFCNLVSIVSTLCFVAYYQLNGLPHISELLLAHASEKAKEKVRQKFALASFYLWLSANFTQRVGRVAHLVHFNFYFNEVYNFVAFSSFHSFYHAVFVNFDKGLLELLGPTGASRAFGYMTERFAVVYKKGLAYYLFVIYNTFLTYFYIVELFLMQNG